MIIDAHTHVFDPGLAPAAAGAGTSARLEAEMEANGVDRALLIAMIGKDSDSNARSIQCEHESPRRFTAFPSVDSMNSPTYHTPGAADRLEALHELHGGIRGFAHYCRDYEWFETPEGRRFLAKAAELKHTISIAVFAPGLEVLARVAQRFPSITFLVHHLGRLQEKNQPAPDRAALAAAIPPGNLWFKISGFHHLAANPRGYPFPELQPVVRELYEKIGPRRLVWGSDFPIVAQFLTYRESIDVFRDQAPYIAASDKDLILGGNLSRLFSLA